MDIYVGSPEGVLVMAGQSLGGAGVLGWKGSTNAQHLGEGGVNLAPVRAPTPSKMWQPPGFARKTSATIGFMALRADPPPPLPAPCPGFLRRTLTKGIHM